MGLPTSFKVSALIIVFCVLGAAATWDWDYMDCHNHGVFNPNRPYMNCSCYEGWTGLDCSLCMNGTMCGKNQICDKSMIIMTQKAYSCQVIDFNLVQQQGAATAQWDFSSEEGSGNVTFFVFPTGAPYLFNCSFTGCQKSVDVDAQTTKVSCQHTSCRCSSWCNTMVLGIINGMKTVANFECGLTTSQCIITQNEMPLAIKLQCDAAGCQSGPYVPPESTLSQLALGLVIVGGIISGSLIAATATYSFYVFKHKYGKKHHLVKVHPDFEVTLTWENLTCIINGRWVLHDISGYAKCGEVTAILGPSGAGKTTFLDMIAGRKNTGVVSGQILVNGYPRTKSWKRISGYVMQDDRMMGTLTVKEHLMTVAMLRLPESLSYDEKEERVEEVMKELSIAHIANSRIGTATTRGISGGERRRLSIASELITDPSILFLDEPTSGLDSYTAFALMETLKTLAESKKRTVIVSIHQPRSNIFTLFDNLLVLSYGKVVYFGSAEKALPYFDSLGQSCPEHYNPADYIIDTVTMHDEAFVRNLANSFEETKTREVLETIAHVKENGVPLSVLGPEFNKEYASSVLMQFYVLAQRTLLNNLRNPYLLRVQYLVTIALALLLGGIFFDSSYDLNGVQNRMGCLFFMISLLSFGAMSSIDTFFEERPLFLRERANGMYRTSTYFVAKTVCDVVPMRIIPPILMGGIAYYMVGFNPPAANFLWFILTLVLVSFVAASMCLAISSFVPSLSLGNLIAILLLLFYMLFSGFLLNKTSISPGINWFKWVSFLEYAFEILMVNEFETAVVIFNPAGEKSINTTVNGKVFLQQFDMDPSRFYLDFAVLGVMAVVYLSLSYLFLRFAIKEKR